MLTQSDLLLMQYIIATAEKTEKSHQTESIYKVPCVHHLQEGLCGLCRGVLCTDCVETNIITVNCTLNFYILFTKIIII